MPPARAGPWKETPIRFTGALRQSGTRHVMSESWNAPVFFKYADVARARGQQFRFHCCGDMYPLINEYIVELRMDAKHSFEGAVVPVTEVKRCYGERLTLLAAMNHH